MSDKNEFWDNLVMSVARMRTEAESGDGMVELAVSDKPVTTDEGVYCGVCKSRDAERIRVYYDGWCLLQLYRCDDCGTYRSWAGDRAAGRGIDDRFGSW